MLTQAVGDRNARKLRVARRSKHHTQLNEQLFHLLMSMSGSLHGLRGEPRQRVMLEYGQQAKRLESVVHREHRVNIESGVGGSG